MDLHLVVLRWPLWSVSSATQVSLMLRWVCYENYVNIRVLPRILWRPRGGWDLGGVTNHIKASMLHLLKDQRDPLAEFKWFILVIVYSSFIGQSEIQLLQRMSSGLQNAVDLFSGEYLHAHVTHNCILLTNTALLLALILLLIRKVQ